VYGYGVADARFAGTGGGFSCFDLEAGGGARVDTSIASYIMQRAIEGKALDVCKFEGNAPFGERKSAQQGRAEGYQAWKPHGGYGYGVISDL
jgi:hypothetical protein